MSPDPENFRQRSYRLCKDAIFAAANDDDGPRIVRPRPDARQPAWLDDLQICNLPA